MDKTGVMTLNPILLAIKEEPTNPIPPGAIIIDNPSPYFWQINLKENKKTSLKRQDRSTFLRLKIVQLLFSKQNLSKENFPVAYPQFPQFLCLAGKPMLNHQQSMVNSISKGRIPRITFLIVITLHITHHTPMAAHHIPISHIKTEPKTMKLSITVHQMMSIQPEQLAI